MNRIKRSAVLRETRETYALYFDDGIFGVKHKIMVLDKIHLIRKQNTIIHTWAILFTRNVPVPVTMETVSYDV